ncbi:hypothetical protein [Methylobacterium haplocladii]|uniref:Uncharacterized protein n=1 Tax=Methylobacterium haplocladii TaxID=1176176 RepID=A0A512IQ60_9HYPH|nr:hypothetical protein [Methylobacterium haplocladii]GEO99863.1 hypothetical protein MHA02_22510 [Methylobacterium haplocladii]GJD82777.1 hypothetical protein HPGCJGGD_0637 [Methylobacterium haplocladii]GLS58027.1 hypothetical protein GCM10007887_06830 [Methylobacterium haplocladii]
MSDENTSHATITRKPDDVGKSGPPATGGGHQTPEQAAITGMGRGGLTDADRSHDRPDAGAAAERSPTATGGSSGGHSDQKSASGGGKVAGGHYDVEKDRE